MVKDSTSPVTSVKLLSALIGINKEDPDLYWNRAHHYREIEMFVDATDDLQSAADSRPYPQASISNKTFYETMQGYFRTLGLDFN